MRGQKIVRFPLTSQTRYCNSLKGMYIFFCFRILRYTCKRAQHELMLYHICTLQTQTCFLFSSGYSIIVFLPRLNKFVHLKPFIKSIYTSRLYWNRFGKSRQVYSCIKISQKIASLYNNLR